MKHSDGPKKITMTREVSGDGVMGDFKLQVTYLNGDSSEAPIFLNSEQLRELGEFLINLSKGN